MLDGPKKKKVEVTEELIQQGKSKKGGWTRKQLGLIGVSWPPVAGWKKRVLGTKVPYENAEMFVSHD